MTFFDFFGASLLSFVYKKKGKNNTLEKKKVRKDKKHLNFDYDNMIDYSQELFYHGTSDSLSLSVLLPPSLTGRLREDWRQKTLDKIFLTNSLKSAQMYAKKASIKFGGNPIVYIVKPKGDIWKVNKTEFVADYAEIISAV